MGSFNVNGFLSHISISYEDKVAMFLCIRNRNAAECFYPCSTITPIVLPIFGEYDDYGGITNVVRTPDVEWLENNVGNLEDVVEAFAECMSEFTPTINKCLRGSNKFHPQTKVRYVYENLLKLGLDKDDSLCVLFEHESIYKTCKAQIRKMSTKEALTIPTTINNIPIKNIPNAELFLSDSISLSTLCDKHFFANDSYNVLALYRRNIQLLRDTYKAVDNFSDFIGWLEGNQKAFTLPVGSYRQDDNYDEIIKFNEKCNKLALKLKNK